MDPHRPRVCSKRGNKITHQSQISELNTEQVQGKRISCLVRMDERRLTRSLGSIKDEPPKALRSGMHLLLLWLSISAPAKGEGKEQGCRYINCSDILSNAELPYSKDTPLQALCSEQGGSPSGILVVRDSCSLMCAGGRYLLLPVWSSQLSQKTEFSWYMGGSKNMGNQEKRGNSFKKWEAQLKHRELK